MFAANKLELIDRASSLAVRARPAVVISSSNHRAEITVDVREAYRAYRDRLLTNNGFLLSLCAALEKMYLTSGLAMSRDSLVYMLRKTKYQNLNDLATAVELLVTWCDANQVTLVDL